MKPAICRWCEFSESELRFRRLANGGSQIVYQCLQCGRSASNPLSQASVPNYKSLPAFDEVLPRQYDQSRSEEALNEKAENRAKWFSEHDAYLKTPEWKARRAAVMRRANGTCEGCGGQAATQVHHLTYDHWREEFLWELVAICDDCHERIHPHMQGVEGSF